MTHATCILGVAAAILTATAGAAPHQTDLELNVGASLVISSPTLSPNGATVTITRRTFWVHVDVSLISPTPGGQIRLRTELGGGLRWGSDGPDPGESCTATETTGECTTDDLQPVTGRASSGWSWEVAAPANGTYTFEGTIVQSPHTDPVAGNNSSKITIVVAEPTGGTGGSGAGGGSGGSTSVSASAVAVSPAKPKAGGAFRATVRITAGGAPVRATSVTCTGFIGKVTLRGIGTGRSGSATCLYRTPLGARGKTVRGTVTFTARATKVTRRFSARLS
jgi:hypothetical protein